MSNIQSFKGPIRRSAGTVLRAIAACGAISILAASSTSVQAQSDINTPVVIELFTSQGCSSCPPADRLLEKLARKPNVIALSLPVDYWDYIGWKDTYASAAFTERQKAYARSRRDRHVYTPQVVVNGLQHGVGSNYGAVKALAKDMHGRSGALQVSMKTKVQGGKVICELGARAGKAPQKASLWLFRVIKSRQVKIGRGENRGRAVTYVNIVRSMERIAEWDGKPKTVEIAASKIKKNDSEGWVLMLQSGSASRPGAILAASKSDGF